MRFTVPIALGVLASTAVWVRIPDEYWRGIAWAVLCATIVLSVVDVLVWQIVKGLDDYATRFQGPSDALAIVLTKVWARKKGAFVLFVVNFSGRAFTATVTGAITASKISITSHRWLLPVAVGVTVFSIPILVQQVVSYFRIGQELGQQMLRARREAERAEELKRAAERPPAMTSTDDHTSGYTKIVPWK